VRDFAYPLPPERIAQEPIGQRDQARLLVATQPIRNRRVADLPEELRPGDLVVANQTRVRAARLRGRRPGGGAAELLVLGAVEAGRAACLVRPARKLPAGTTLHLGDGLEATVEEPSAGHPGARMVRFTSDGDIDAAIERHGTAPLPPYITRSIDDPERYQTVYARGAAVSAAAPTAGLHITDAVLAALAGRGVGWTTIDLEVGLGTFSPMTAERVEDHVMHEERFHVGAEAAAAIARTRADGGRVVAIGTTVVRVLESVATAGGDVTPGSGSTGLFIRPGHDFHVVDGLVTNFHQPRSSLLVLVAAFCGTTRWREIYAHALEQGYRFLSFGDCMLAWRGGRA
jgi:S-adenosylmethionine:tRNA ribosyltransferase-isomerase